MTPELCSHNDVDRVKVENVGIHCICNSCFEEWVE